MTRIAKWIDQHRFFVIFLTLVLMWVWIMFFFFTKAEAISNDPCSVCAKRLGEEVFCTAGTSTILQKTFYPNLSIVQGPVMPGTDEKTFRKTGRTIKNEPNIIP